MGFKSAETELMTGKLQVGGLLLFLDAWTQCQFLDDQINICITKKQFMPQIIGSHFNQSQPSCVQYLLSAHAIV